MLKIILRASQELGAQPVHFGLWDVGGSLARRTSAHIYAQSGVYIHSSSSETSFLLHSVLQGFAEAYLSCLGLKASCETTKKSHLN